MGVCVCHGDRKGVLQDGQGLRHPHPETQQPALACLALSWNFPSPEHFPQLSFHHFLLLSPPSYLSCL